MRTTKSPLVDGSRFLGRGPEKGEHETEQCSPEDEQEFSQYEDCSSYFSESKAQAPIELINGGFGEPGETQHAAAEGRLHPHAISLR